MYCFLSEAGGGPAGGRGPSSGRRPVEAGADGLAASSAGPTGGSGGVLGAGGLDASPEGPSSSGNGGVVEALDDAAAAVCEASGLLASEALPRTGSGAWRLASALGLVITTLFLCQVGA